MKNKEYLWWLFAVGMFIGFWTMQWITPIPCLASFVGLLYVNTKSKL